MMNGAPEFTNIIKGNNMNKFVQNCLVDARVMELVDGKEIAHDDDETVQLELEERIDLYGKDSEWCSYHRTLKTPMWNVWREYSGHGTQDIHWEYLDRSLESYLLTAKKGDDVPLEEGDEWDHTSLGSDLASMVKGSGMFWAAGYNPFSKITFYFPYDRHQIAVRTIQKELIDTEWPLLEEEGVRHSEQSWEDGFTVKNDLEIVDRLCIKRTHDKTVPVQIEAECVDPDHCGLISQFKGHHVQFNGDGWLSQHVVQDDDIESLVRTPHPNRMPLMLDKLTSSVASLRSELRSQMETAI